MSEAPTFHSADSVPAPQDGGQDFTCLPGYSRSLLKIQLPVSVTLANKRVPLKEVLELVTGSIIQFDKQCDEPLTLDVRGHAVAEGEAVKVGDRFGIRLTSILRRGARLQPVAGKRAERAHGARGSTAPPS
jgi:flagellar motor switch protein FliN